MAAPLSVAALNPAPAFTSTVRVRMIDTTGVLALDAKSFVKPVMPGHETLSMTVVAFLIENESLGKKAMFDLGIRKDYWNCPPATARRIKEAIPGIRVDKDVTEILKEKGIELGQIDDIIWSHSHWDHMGSPQLFPPSTNLHYGKGTGIFPGYPENEASNLDAKDFANRTCTAVECNELQIGPFPAKDFYGDGSFYLLDTPGHWPGHICGLARTSPGTFVFLGGDICHFAGDFRPSQWIPLPDTVPEDAFRGNAGKYPLPCPCSFFTDHHPQLHAHDDGEDKTSGPTANTSTLDKQKTPFYDLSTHKISSYKDPAVASVTMDKMKDFFDSNPNVLVCLSHDPTLLDYLPTLNDNPDMDLNSWKEQGLKEKCHWGWLAELPRYKKDGSVEGYGYRDKPIVEGHWKEGKRIELS